MNPQLVFLIIASLTDTLIDLATKDGSMSKEQFEAELISLQTKADDQEAKLRGGGHV